MLNDEMHGKTNCIKLQAEGTFPPAAIEYLSESVIHNTLKHISAAA